MTDETVIQIEQTNVSVTIQQPADNPIQVTESPVSINLTTETVISGPKGDPGVSDFVGRFVAGQDILIGQPVFISKINKKALIADSSTFTSCFIIGFASENISNGFQGDIKKGSLTLNDWTPITGSSSLNVGCNYYLNGAGTLSVMPPSSGGLIVVGIAISDQTLLFKPNFPILL